MDAYRGIQFAAVATTLARVIADSAVHSRHRVVAYECFPCFAVLARLGQVEPALDVLARRASVVARWQKINVDGTLVAYWTGTLTMGQVDDRRHITRLGNHCHVSN